jgi:hypothetical protein
MEIRSQKYFLKNFEKQFQRRHGVRKQTSPTDVVSFLIFRRISKFRRFDVDIVECNAARVAE